jgi:hypothetical protein
MALEILVTKVTPKLAEQWLNANTGNRKMREGVSEKYAEDMKAGRWTTCPEPISFYDDGALADGQHRLWAIVESGCAISFPIARGLTKEDGLNINTGLTRSLVDNARISGVNVSLSNEILGVARAVAEGVKGGKAISAAHRLELVNQHDEPVRWAVSNGVRGKGLRNAMVLAAMARAWYYETDTDLLRRFADVMSSGFADGESESAAIALRNYMLAKGPTASGTALWRDTFLKAQNAIHYFMRGKKLTVIKTVKDECYPLKRTRAKAKA